MGWNDGSVVRALAGLSEDLGSTPSTRMAIPGGLASLRHFGVSLLASEGTACKCYTDMHADKTPVHTK